MSYGIHERILLNVASVLNGATVTLNTGTALTVLAELERVEDDIPNLSGDVPGLYIRVAELDNEMNDKDCSFGSVQLNPAFSVTIFVSGLSDRTGDSIRKQVCGVNDQIHALIMADPTRGGYATTTVPQNMGWGFIQYGDKFVWGCEMIYEARSSIGNTNMTIKVY
jgi:hypothetical protein